MKKRVGVRLLALVLIIALLGSMVPVSAASNYYIGTARNWRTLPLPLTAATVL